MRLGCGVLVRALFLACRQPPSRYVLTWPFLVCAQKREEEGEGDREREVFLFLEGNLSHPEDPTLVFFLVF